MFQPKVFAELQNAQAIVLPYDGLNPLPPTYCYLKPHYLDVKPATSTTPRKERSDMSFDVILPFLRPIAHLIQDPDVSEIMVNGSRRIFVERQGLLEAVDGVELDERNLQGRRQEHRSGAGRRRLGGTADPRLATAGRLARRRGPATL